MLLQTFDVPILMSEAGDKTQFPESILWTPQLRGLLE